MDIEFKKRFAKAFEKSGCVPKLMMKKLQASSGNHNGNWENFERKKVSNQNEFIRGLNLNVVISSN